MFRATVEACMNMPAAERVAEATPTVSKGVSQRHEAICDKCRKIMAYPESIAAGRCENCRGGASPVLNDLAWNGSLGAMS